MSGNVELDRAVWEAKLMDPLVSDEKYDLLLGKAFQALGPNARKKEQLTI